MEILLVILVVLGGFALLTNSTHKEMELARQERFDVNGYNDGTCPSCGSYWVPQKIGETKYALQCPECGYVRIAEIKYLKIKDYLE